MKQRSTRWPIWKIVLTMVLTAVAAVGMTWLSSIVESATPTEETAADTRQNPAGFSVANFIRIFAVASGLMTVFCAGWLVYRRRLAVPRWKRPARMPPKRR